MPIRIVRQQLDEDEPVKMDLVISTIETNRERIRAIGNMMITTSGILIPTTLAFLLYFVDKGLVDLTVIIALIAGVVLFLASIFTSILSSMLRRKVYISSMMSFIDSLNRLYNSELKVSYASFALLMLGIVAMTIRCSCILFSEVNMTMTSETSSEPANLLGVLECPLRKGYIEFEYQIGDTVAELKQKVSEAWGPPVALGRKLDRDHWHGGLTDRGVWVILCETQSGAYLPLTDQDKIPTTPPASPRSLKRPRFSPNPSKQWDLPAGVIYDQDVADVFLSDYRRFQQAQGSQEIDMTEPVEPKTNLDLGLVRQYETPQHKQYSPRLIALVVITGG